MRVNLRIGFMVENHSREVEDGAVLRRVIDAIDRVRGADDLEVVLAVYTPHDSVWVVTLNDGTFELQQDEGGRWQAKELEV